MQHEAISLRPDGDDLAIELDRGATFAQIVGERHADSAERAPRISEPFASGARALPAPEHELRPEPGERDLLRVIAELAEHQRQPNRTARALAARASQPLERADVVHTLPVGAADEPQHDEAEPYAVRERERRVREQVPGRDEWVGATAGEDP